MASLLTKRGLMLPRARLAQPSRCWDLQYAYLHISSARRAKAADPRIEDIADVPTIEDQFAVIREDYSETSSTQSYWAALTHTRDAQKPYSPCTWSTWI